MNTHVPPRLEWIKNAPNTRVGTNQRPAPIMPPARSTRYKDIEKRENSTPQKEMDIIENLTETEIKNLFSGLGVTEDQYSF